MPRIKVWSDAEILNADDLNAEFDNVLEQSVTPDSIDDCSSDVLAMQTAIDPYPAGSVSLSTSLSGEIKRLRYLIKQITGEDYWYVDPDTTIAALTSAVVLKTLFDANTILAADADNVPAAVTIAEDRVVGRKTGGNITALTLSEILDFIGSTAEGDTIYRGTSTWDRLAKGTANYKKFMNAAGTAPEWDSGIKIGTFTRGMSVASGNVSITGVGFKPSVVIFLSCLASTSMTIGFDDASTHISIMNHNSGTNYYYTSISIMLWYASSNYQEALLKSLDSDGFTLTWSKTGSPGGTAIIHYLAIR